MAREPKFKGTIVYSRRPLTGITVYHEGERGPVKEELTLEEMLDELEKDEIRGARKALVLNNLRERLNPRAKDGTAAPSQLNAKRFTVDQETGRIDVDEEEGQYTAKDAALVSASIRGKTNQGWGINELSDLLDKINEKRGNGPTTKVYAVEQTEQGAILKEVSPDSPLTLGQLGGGRNQPMLIIDSDGVVQEMKPGLRVGTRQAAGAPPPQKITLVRQTEKGLVKESYDAGETIILNSPNAGSNSPMVPFPVFGSDGRPVLDQEGKPVYANLEPTLRWMGFQAEQTRAQQRHEQLMGLAQTVKENLPDGIRALVAAAEEAKAERKGTGVSQEAAATPQIFECGHCHTRFRAPDEPGWTSIQCPNPQCAHIYTRQEIEGT